MILNELIFLPFLSLRNSKEENVKRKRRKEANWSRKRSIYGKNQNGVGKGERAKREGSKRRREKKREAAGAI